MRYFRRELLAVFMFCLLSTNAYAEGIVVTPFYGYQFGGNIKTYQGELQIKNSENMGFTIDIPYTKDTTIQLLYITQDTKLTLKNNFLGSTVDLSDMRVEYYHLGSTKEAVKGDVTTFASGSFGVTLFSPTDGRYSDESLFSLSFGGGAIKHINKRLALRIQGRLLLPIQTAGGSLFCGPNGCAAGISGGTSIVQADITAGLVFKF